MNSSKIKPLNAISKMVLISLSLVILYGCRDKVNKGISTETDVWNLRDSIINNIGTISFPDKTFNILDFGAVGDGEFFNQNAIDQAIKKCHEEGGGKVLIPKGKYLTGPIHLEDNINLHLDKGAEIIFSTDLQHFPIVNTSYEGTECRNYSPLIYAYQKKNIAITGQGTLNGSANNENWWPWCGNQIYGWKEGDPKQHSSLKKLKEDMSEKGVPPSDRVFGEGEYLRPTFIEPFECENVLIQGISIINAPFWVIHPFRSNNIIIDGVTVDSHGPNNDGCDPEYSKNIWIKNCTFNTGDDCIAIKAGRNEDGRRVNIKSENIVIEGCNMIDGHGGVVIGSEMSAGVRNVFVRNCSMSSPNLDRAIRIKTNTKRGGTVENLFVKDIKVGVVKEAFLKVNLHYGIYGNQNGEFMPQVSNVTLENITVQDGGKYGILIDGYEDHPVKNILLRDITIESVEEPFSIKGAKNVELINTIINDKAYNQKVI